jgi:hypothetical protein
MMKEIFGKEWRWFRGLSIGEKLRVIWFCVSLCVVLCVVDCCNWLWVAVIVNLTLSYVSIVGIRFDIEE